MDTKSPAPALIRSASNDSASAAEQHKILVSARCYRSMDQSAVCRAAIVPELKLSHGSDDSPADVPAASKLGTATYGYIIGAPSRAAYPASHAKIRTASAERIDCRMMVRAARTWLQRSSVIVWTHCCAHRQLYRAAVHIHCACSGGQQQIRALRACRQGIACREKQRLQSSGHHLAAARHASPT